MFLNIKNGVDKPFSPGPLKIVIEPHLIVVYNIPLLPEFTEWWQVRPEAPVGYYKGWKSIVARRVNASKKLKACFFLSPRIAPFEFWLTKPRCPPYLLWFNHSIVFRHRIETAGSINASNRSFCCLQVATNSITVAKSQSGVACASHLFHFIPCRLS